MRRYLFAEVFAVIGFAELYKATKDVQWLHLAMQTLAVIDTFKEKLPAKVCSDTRPMRGHSWTMILISMYQILRDADDKKNLPYDNLISKQIREIFDFFVKTERQILLETTAFDGAPTEGCEGRCVNPGHSI